MRVTDEMIAKAAAVFRSNFSQYDKHTAVRVAHEMLTAACADPTPPEYAEALARQREFYPEIFARLTQP